MRYTQVPATCDLTCNTIDMEDMAGWRVEEMAAANPRFKCVFVVGDKPDDLPPPGIAGAEVRI